MIADLPCFETELLDGHLGPSQLVNAHVHFAKAALAKVLDEFEGIDAHAVVEVFTEGVKERLLLE